MINLAVIHILQIRFGVKVIINSLGSDERDRERDREREKKRA